LIGPAALLLLLLAGMDGGERPPARGTIVVRHQQIILRMPSGARTLAPAGPSLIRWRQSRGPRCVPASQLVGATLLGQNSVDLILRDSTRMRAQLQSRCPALDFYRGFYLNATQDGRICADRDSIRSRVGGQCAIERFRLLSAHARD